MADKYVKNVQKLLTQYVKNMSKTYPKVISKIYERISEKCP